MPWEGEHIFHHPRDHLLRLIDRHQQSVRTASHSGSEENVMLYTHCNIRTHDITLFMYGWAAAAAAAGVGEWMICEENQRWAVFSLTNALAFGVLLSACVCLWGSAYLLSGAGVDVALHFISCLFRCWSHFSPLFLCHSYFELLVINEVASIQRGKCTIYSGCCTVFHFATDTFDRRRWQCGKTGRGSVSSAFCVVPGMVPTEHTMGEFCKTKPSKSAHEIAEIVLRIAAS